MTNYALKKNLKYDKNHGIDFIFFLQLRSEK